MGLSLAKSFAAALLRACKSMASTAGGMNTCVWLGGDPRVALGVKTASCHTCCGISLDGIYDCHVSIFAWEYIEIYRAGIDRYHFGNVLFQTGWTDGWCKFSGEDGTEDLILSCKNTELTELKSILDSSLAGWQPGWARWRGRSFWITISYQRTNTSFQWTKMKPPLHILQMVSGLIMFFHVHFDSQFKKETRIPWAPGNGKWEWGPIPSCMASLLEFNCYIGTACARTQICIYIYIYSRCICDYEYVNMCLSLSI